MAQRFPLSTLPFPRMELADADKRHFHVLATQQLAQALSEYEEHLLMQQRRVDTKRWKPVKAQANLTVYRESRAYAVANGTAPPGSSWGSEDGDESVTGTSIVSSHHGSGSGSVEYEQPTYHQTEEELLSGWGPTASEVSQRKKRAKSRSNSGFGRMLNPGDQLPTLLGVGCISGSLDDVMYAVAAPDCASIALKAAYIGNHFLDGDVLYQIEGPSTRSPFRFLGLKWHVKSSATTATRSPTWPRDVVYLEATGVVTRADGQRVGYQVIHSVPLSTCPELQESHGVVRAHCESVYLFAALPNGSVDVFLKAKVTPNGKVYESAGVEGCTETLLSFGTIVECAQSKKLAWQLAREAESRGDMMGVGTEVPKPKRCSTCSKSFGRFSRQPVVCKLCSAAMCSKCCITRELHQVTLDGRRRRTSKQVASRTVLLCKNCVMGATQTSSLSVAQEEVASGRFGRGTRSTRSHSGTRHSGDDDTVSSSASNSTVDEEGSVSIRYRPTPEEAPMSIRSRQQEIPPPGYQRSPSGEFPPSNHRSRRQDELPSGRYRQQEDRLPQYRDPSLHEALLGIPHQEMEHANSRRRRQGEVPSRRPRYPSDDLPPPSFRPRYPSDEGPPPSYRQRYPGEEIPVPSYPPRYPADNGPPSSYSQRYPGDEVPPPSYRPRYHSDEAPVPRSRPRYPSDETSQRSLRRHYSGGDSPPSTRPHYLPDDTSQSARHRYPAEGVPPNSHLRQQEETRPVHRPRYVPDEAVKASPRQPKLAPLKPLRQQNNIPNSRRPATQPEVTSAPRPCAEEEAFRLQRRQQLVAPVAPMAPPAPEDNSEVETQRQERYHSHEPPVVLYEPEEKPSYSREESASKITSSSSSSLEGIHLDALTLATAERLATATQPEPELGGSEDWDKHDASAHFNESGFSDDVVETLDTKDMQAVRRRSQCHRQLWDQIAELRNQAENVYQYTKTNAAAHAAGVNGLARGQQIANQ